MTGITADGIEIERTIQAPAETVFATWATAPAFARWFGGAEVDVPRESLDYTSVVGREWHATMVLPDGRTIDWAGEFVEVTPPTRFVFTLTDDPSSPDRAAVDVRLEQDGEVTRLWMTQETPGFDEEARHAVLAGWEGFVDVLVAIAEGREGLD